MRNIVHLRCINELKHTICVLANTFGELMSIKLSIGRRISEARKSIGLSQVQLSQLTGFGKARLSNWETGFRTPKLEEAKILEKYLKVPAAFLLCLTNEKIFPEHFGERIVSFKSIPMFIEDELYKIDQAVQIEMYNTKNYLPIYPENNARIDSNFFAFQLFDDSMSPIYHKDDIIVFNSQSRAHHNDDVLVKIKDSNEVLFRKLFMETSSDGSTKIKLQPINDHWSPIDIPELSKIIIFGIASYKQRIFT